MKYLLLFSIGLFLNSAFTQTVDSIAIKQVDSLILVSQDLTGKRDFENALEVIAVAEKLALEKFGYESVAYGSCCLNRGRVNYFLNNYSEAEIGYLEAIDIQQKLLGKEHPDYARSLNNLAILYSDLGAYEKAEPLYLESKTIREKVLGTEHPDYAWSLNDLASLYLAMGHYQKAEPLYLEAKDIRGKVLGKEHPQYSGVLNNLALLYWHMGHHEKAEPLYLEAKDIDEKLLGKEHPDDARSLNNLAILYWSMAQYEKAEPLYLKAKAIQEKVLGVEHPDYAKSLNNLAILYWSMGQYEKAELHYLEAKIIREKVLGKEHPDYATSLNNLAVLYFSMGNYEKAEPLYIESIDILEKKLEKEHPDYAHYLSNLAVVYWRMGNFEKAEMYYLKTKVIRENTIGKEHPDYAVSLEGLALLYNALGNYKKAETLFLEALIIREKTIGKYHPTYATSLENIAILYQLMNNFEKAEPLFLEANTIREKILGKDHPSYAENLHFQINIYETQNRYSESEPLLNLYFELTQSHLIQSVAFLSARELANYSATFQLASSNLMSFLHTRITKNQLVGILPDLAYNQALFEKGFLLTAASRQNSLAAFSTETEEINNQLKGFRRRIAAEISKTISERQGLAELEEKANTTEKELTRLVAGYSENMRQINWQDIQKKLNPEEAAIEFIHFRVSFPEKTDSVMYAALLLKPGMDQPAFIPLFEQRELDILLRNRGLQRADNLNNLYATRGLTLQDQERTPVYVRLGGDRKSLYDLVWQKLEDYGLDGINTIYYAPSGILHRLNLGAIGIDEEHHLADRYRFISLTSTRQLVIPSSVIIQEDNALVIGGAEFEVEDKDRHPEDQPQYASRSMADFWSETGTRGGTWNYLNWTKEEARQIANSLEKSNFSVHTLTGVDASEEAIKAIGVNGPSPRILHIATHGFFFPDPEVRNEVLGLGESEPVFKSSDNPMIRSGLVMAGGNYAWQQGRAIGPDKEDGILTAYEISQMNLSNTELVVLSACETGLGDIQGNEGVYGLQRAFKIAGAKYLIMSLWQVPDRETMEFMTTFYTNWLDGKMTIPDAFRKTQRDMRDRFFNPYSWAGFVLVE